MLPELKKPHGFKVLARQPELPPSSQISRIVRVAIEWGRLVVTAA